MAHLLFSNKIGCLSANKFQRKKVGALCSLDDCFCDSIDPVGLPRDHHWRKSSRCLWIPWKIFNIFS